MKIKLSISVILLSVFITGCVKYKTEETVHITGNFNGSWILTAGDNNIEEIIIKDSTVLIKTSGNTFNGELTKNYSKSSKIDLGIYESKTNYIIPSIEFIKNENKVTLFPEMEKIGNNRVIKISESIYHQNQSKNEQFNNPKNQKL